MPEAPNSKIAPDEEPLFPFPSILTGIVVVGACLVVGGMLISAGESFRAAVAPFRRARQDAVRLIAPDPSPEPATPAR